MACIPQTLIHPDQELISQVNADTWLMGPLLLHSVKGPCDTSTWYDQDDNYSYTVTTAPTPKPASVSLPADDPKIKLAYDAEDCSAVWSTGNSAFCKVKISVIGITAEATTLDFVHRQKPGNVIVVDVPEIGDICIIDWEITGYFPRGWIRTKFRMSGGMRLPNFEKPLE